MPATSMFISLQTLYVHRGDYIITEMNVSDPKRTTQHRAESRNRILAFSPQEILFRKRVSASEAVLAGLFRRTIALDTLVNVNKCIDPYDIQSPAFCQDSWLRKQKDRVYICRPSFSTAYERVKAVAHFWRSESKKLMVIN